MLVYQRVKCKILHGKYKQIRCEQYEIEWHYESAFVHLLINGWYGSKNASKEGSETFRHSLPSCKLTLSKSKWFPSQDHCLPLLLFRVAAFIATPRCNNWEPANCTFPCIYIYIYTHTLLYKDNDKPWDVRGIPQVWTYCISQCLLFFGHFSHFFVFH